MPADTTTLQALVNETADLVRQVSFLPLTSVTGPKGYFSLAGGWTSNQAAAIVPFKSLTQQLDDLVDQMFPPPPADALPVGQVVQLFVQAWSGGSSTDQLAALSELDKLSWPDRFSVLEALSNQGPTLDGQTYLELIEGTVQTLPNVDVALHAAMIVILMTHGGRTLTSIDISVNFMQTLALLGERDQWQMLSRLGVADNAIEGTMAAFAAQAVAVGMMQMSPQLIDALAGGQGSTPIGKWEPPGNMPGGYYIGLAAHAAIAAEYRALNLPPVHNVFTNTTPVDTILSQLQGQLMFKGNRLAVALGLSKPDIFDFGISHPDPAPGWVYEIKPWNNLATAEVEALFYADALILAGIPSQPGPLGTPGTSGCLPAPGGWFAFAALAPGAIVYWYRKATNEELEAQGMVPVVDAVEQQTVAALNAAGATATVVGAAGVLVAIYKALMDAGWILAFLAAA